MGNPRFAWLGAWLGFLGVLLGAFGTHALRTRIPVERLAVWDTANRYHLVHAVVLLALGFSGQASARSGRLAERLPWLFVAGIAVFSGTLYAYAATGARPFAIVAPVGGACFLAGWLALALSVRRRAEG